MYTNVTQIGNKLFVREIRDGKRTQSRVDFRPTFFVPANRGGEYTDIRESVRLAPMEFDSIYDAREFIKTQGKSANASIYGMDDYSKQFVQKNFQNRTIDKNLLKIFFLDIEVESDDGFPYPEYATKKVTAITIFDSISKLYHVWGLGSWSAEDSTLEKRITEKVRYRRFESEESLLRDFIRFFSENYPDIVTGWNTEGFDIPYLYNRITNVLGEEYADQLSPCRSAYSKMSKTKFGKDLLTVKINGISSLDYLLLYQKYNLKMQEAYNLDHIAYVELKERKLSYDEARSLFDLYKTNYQKFIDYNIKDVDLVIRIDKKRNMIGLVVDMAYYAGINYEETFYPVRIWDTMIYDFLLQNKIVIPLRQEQTGSDDDELEGAVVKEPKIGLFGWIGSFDFSALYPTIARQWNLGPDTMVEDIPEGLEKVFEMRILNDILSEEIRKYKPVLVENNVTIAANGTVYTNRKDSFFRSLMGKITKERKEAKDIALDAGKKLAAGVGDKEELQSLVDRFSTREQSLKVLNNSGYGALGNKYFRFYDVRIAEAITITGQVAALWVGKNINKYLCGIFGDKKERVIYFDTDSAYVDLQDFVDKFCVGEKFKDENQIVDFLDTVCKTIQTKCINKACLDLQEMTNCSSNIMEMKREVIASSGFWKAKKNYALRILDSEGKRKEDIKIMGLAAVKSTNPEICRDAMKKVIRAILERKPNEETIKICSDFWEEYRKLPIESQAYNTSINDIEKYTDSNGDVIGGAQQHIRAAVLYNKAISVYNLQNRLEPIRNGEKIKVAILNRRNPLRADVIAFTQFFPREFGLEKYIDSKALFEKTFMSHMKQIAEVTGYQVENNNDISSFFM